METTPALDAALAASQATVFFCGKADLPGYTLRLLEASGQVAFSEGTFTGFDGRFGKLGGIEALTDGVGDQAPALSITFIPADGAAAADLSSPAFQGSRIRLWLGALVGGAVVADPYLIFDGTLDVPELMIDEGTREVSFTCTSSFERLFRAEEGNRLSDAHHKEVWPGETGLSAVTGIVKQVLWGPGDKIGASVNSAGGGTFVGEIANLIMATHV